MYSHSSSFGGVLLAVRSSIFLIEHFPHTDGHPTRPDSSETSALQAPSNVTTPRNCRFLSGGRYIFDEWHCYNLGPRTSDTAPQCSQIAHFSTISLLPILYFHGLGSTISSPLAIFNVRTTWVLPLTAISRLLSGLESHGRLWLHQLTYTRKALFQCVVYLGPLADAFMTPGRPPNKKSKRLTVSMLSPHLTPRRLHFKYRSVPILVGSQRASRNHLPF